MELDEPHLCPHYHPSTLTWYQQEGVVLPCPPNFTMPCSQAEFEEIAKAYYNAEENSETEARYASLLRDIMYSENLDEALQQEYEDMELEEEEDDYLAGIKEGLLDTEAVLIASLTEEQVVSTA